MLTGRGAATGIVAAVTVYDHLDDTVIEILLDGLMPSWVINCYPAPGRIAVELAGCEPPKEMPAAIALLKGAFDDGDSMVFQFTGEIAYKVEQTEDRLIIRVRRSIGIADEWFITADGVSDDLPEGYHNALCMDGVTVAPLSMPFKTQQEAEQALTQLPAEGIWRDSRVIQVEDGKLPPSYEERDMLYYSDYVMLVKDGITIEGRVWGVAMRFLDWEKTADGDALVAKSVSDLRGIRDELWLIGRSGQKALLSHEWIRIISAKYSGSGRYIAIIEDTDGMRLMYVYDTQMDSLTLLVEEGMGSFTDAYAWDGDILYMMNGEDELQLYRVDPSLPTDDPEKIAEVNTAGKMLANIETVDNILYYVDEETSMICAMDTGTFETHELTEGEMFTISPDGAYMAIFFYELLAETNIADADEEDGNNEADTESLMGQTGLKLRHIQSGEETIISSGTTLLSMAFSRDGSMLHYGLSDNTDENTPCRLMTRKTNENMSIDQGLMRAGELYAGSDEATVVAVGYYRAEHAYRAITCEIPIIQ